MNINYKLDEELENIIIEMQRKSIELKLGNVGFDLFTKVYGEIHIKIYQYKNNWEVTVLNERDIKGIYYRFLDMYSLSNEGLLKYNYTEKDRL